MKKYSSILIAVLLSTITFAQNPNYGIPGYSASNSKNKMNDQLNCSVHRKYGKAVQKEKINQALLMRDICEHYPSSWIDSYISTEISVIDNHNKISKVKGLDEKLNQKQKDLLKTADLNSNIVVEIHYNFKNTISNKMEARTMSFSMAVVPDVEAEFQEGDPMQFLLEKARVKLAQINAPKFEQAIINFTINKEGKVVNTKVTASSKDSTIDNVLLELMNTMPKWSPAKNADGSTTTQDLELMVGYMLGC